MGDSIPHVDLGVCGECDRPASHAAFRQLNAETTLKFARCDPHALTAEDARAVFMPLGGYYEQDTDLSFT